MHVDKNFVAIDFVRLKKNNQLEDDKRSTPVYVNHVEEKKFETLSALMYTIFVWNVIEKLHGNQLIWVYIYKKKQNKKPHHCTTEFGSMKRWLDSTMAMVRLRDVLSIHRYRVIVSSRYRLFCTCAVSKKMASGVN